MRSPESQWWDRHKGGVVSVLFTEGGLARRIVGILAWVDVFTIGITVPKNYTHLIFKHAIAKISPWVQERLDLDLDPKLIPTVDDYGLAHAHADISDGVACDKRIIFVDAFFELQRLYNQGDTDGAFASMAEALRRLNELGQPSS